MEAEAESQPHEPFEVRPATRDDVSAIATMQKESLPETYEPFLGRATVGEFVARWERRALHRRTGNRSRFDRDARAPAAGESGELRLEVSTVNARAVDFYTRLGFSISDTMADPETGLEKLVMRKTPGPGG
jgi:hypothetical protein